MTKKDTDIQQKTPGDNKLTGYELNRRWFDFAFDTKECKVYHISLYMWIVELNNRLGWKSEFGLPTHATMEGLSIGNKNTYLETLRSLHNWGFIEIVKESKNQYQACIIKLCHIKSDTAQHTALDTALIQHSTHHSNNSVHGISVGIVPIDKPLTNNQKNKKPVGGFIAPTHDYVKNYFNEKTNWGLVKSEKKAQKFINTYKNNWSRVAAIGIDEKLNNWILEEFEETTQKKYPDTWDPYFYQSLNNTSKENYIAQLKSLGFKEKYNPAGGTSYYNPNANNTTVKTEIKMPDPMYKDAIIPPDVKQ